MSRADLAAQSMGEANTIARTITRDDERFDELLNGITHGMGLVLSIAGCWGLWRLFAPQGTTAQAVGCTIYGASLVVLYSASTMYHSWAHTTWRDALQLFDHVCIYLLIAGTYTPFALVCMPAPWGTILLVLVWTLALVGMVFKLCFSGRGYHKVSLALYLAMGWLALLAAKPILETMPLSAILLLAGGGLVYTAGTIFYVLDSRRFFHAVWHLFVIGGSALHYCAVVYYVAAAPGP